MVKRSAELDLIFGSLASPVRRDILMRSAGKEMSVSKIAKRYNMSLAAISKHLKILEEAHLISKKRRGKEQIVKISPPAFEDAMKHLKDYERLWNDRFDRLEQYLSSSPSPSSL